MDFAVLIRALFCHQPVRTLEGHFVAPIGVIEW